MDSSEFSRWRKKRLKAKIGCYRCGAQGLKPRLDLREFLSLDVFLQHFGVPAAICWKKAILEKRD